MIDSRLFPFAEDMLDWTAKRQQVLSANIANIDTPGYKAKDVSFSDAMQSIQLATTSGAHVGGAESNPRIQIFETDGKPKDNGNTVDLDKSMSDLTKNALQYVALVQYVNQKLKTLRSAINDGGR